MRPHHGLTVGSDGPACSRLVQRAGRSGAASGYGRSALGTQKDSKGVSFKEWTRQPCTMQTALKGSLDL